MLNYLSWASYWEAVIAVLVIYYAFVAIRFYTPDIRQLITRPSLKINAVNELPEQLVYQEEAVADQGLPEEVIYADDHYPDEDILEADELTISVKALVSAASGKPYAPDQLIPQLRSEFQKHQVLTNSPYRPAINELVVSECERTGVAELTEDEVDEWWNS